MSLAAEVRIGRETLRLPQRVGLMGQSAKDVVVVHAHLPGLDDGGLPVVAHRRFAAVAIRQRQRYARKFQNDGVVG